MSKVLIVIKSGGIGDLCILISNIHAVSQKINEPVTVLAQKNTHANEIFKYDPHIDDVIELDEKEIKSFFSIIKKIKDKNFNQSYIYSDSIRFYLISKLSGIKNNFQYDFFSKKGKNFYKTAKKFTEKSINKEIEPQSKIYPNNLEVDIAKKKFLISNNEKNIVCGISASGSTKRWDIKNYIQLFEKLNSKFQCKFFLAAGANDEMLINEIMRSSVGKNCISFSKMKIGETIPIISACNFFFGNDTGFGHISSALGLKCLFLFMDSPPSAYGMYSKNISIIVPDGETIESCGHNTKGKNNISFDKVVNKALQILA